jgi:hypothetical protein
MENKMTDTQSRVRQNYWAILVAALACFFFQAGWYIVFMKQWLEGIGRTREELMSSTALNPMLEYGIALVAAAVVATAISCVTQLTGPQTAIRGIKVAALLWLAFVFTTWATEYTFEVRPLSLLGINAGLWLIAMSFMGAIVGGWKKK